MKQTMTKWNNIVPLLFLCAAPIVSAQTNITLTFNSLPSAQGWTFHEYGTSIAETTEYTLSNNILHQDSMGIGFQAAGSCCYAYRQVVNSNLPFVLTITERVLEEEIGETGNYFGFVIAVFGAQTEFSVGFGTDRIVDDHSYLLTNLDNTVFHNIRLQGTFGTNATAALYVDNNLVSTTTNLFDYNGPPSTNSDFYNSILFGDGTGGANAEADVSAFNFIQQIPEPKVEIYPAVEIDWFAVSNNVYQVQWASQLNSNKWNNFGSPITGTGTNISVFDSTRSSPSKYYRVSEVQ